MTNQKIRKTVAQVMYDMTKTIYEANPNSDELVEIWSRIAQISATERDLCKYGDPS